MRGVSVISVRKMNTTWVQMSAFVLYSSIKKRLAQALLLLLYRADTRITNPTFLKTTGYFCLEYNV